MLGSTGLITISKIYYANRTPYTWCYCLKQPPTHLLEHYSDRYSEEGDPSEKDEYMGNCCQCICSKHIDFTIVPMVLQLAELTEAITSFHFSVCIQSTPLQRGMRRDNLVQLNRC